MYAKPALHEVDLGNEASMCCQIALHKTNYAPIPGVDISGENVSVSGGALLGYLASQTNAAEFGSTPDIQAGVDLPETRSPVEVNYWMTGAWFACL